MGHSHKVRHRAKLVKQTKAPIRAKKFGLSNELLTTKQRHELAERSERRRIHFHEEFRAMARQAPERQPIDRTPLEHEVIAIWSRRMMFDILKAIRGKPEFRLIPKEAKPNGKANRRKCGVAPIRITSFAALVAAFSEREARHAERSET